MRDPTVGTDAKPLRLLCWNASFRFAIPPTAAAAASASLHVLLRAIVVADARVSADLGVGADDVADHAVPTFGALDIMFYNAGVSRPSCYSVRDSGKADFVRVLAINLVEQLTPRTRTMFNDT